MTLLYKPVLISSAEQAEALPTGAVLHRTRGSWPTGLVGMVLRSPYTDRPYYRVGVDHWPVRRVVETFAEALVPIEAEEETWLAGPDKPIVNGQRIDKTAHRWCTPWEEA